MTASRNQKNYHREADWWWQSRSLQNGVKGRDVEETNGEISKMKWRENSEQRGVGSVCVCVCMYVCMCVCVCECE